MFLHVQSWYIALFVDLRSMLYVVICSCMLCSVVTCCSSLYFVCVDVVQFLHVTKSYYMQCCYMLLCW